MLITSDHGNIERVGEVGDGEFDTKHNPNPVPMIFVGEVDIVNMVMMVNSYFESSGVYSGQVIKEIYGL
ncbi:hypothetical protein HC766_00875 [Candidatus Gracilibacteria bacterium]|nr:hypothetical protein [Candidatus Gracilibacteria bacterium]